eukprot:g14635.t1
MPRTRKSKKEGAASAIGKVAKSDQDHAEAKVRKTKTKTLSKGDRGDLVKKLKKKALNVVASTTTTSAGGDNINTDHGAASLEDHDEEMQDRMTTTTAPDEEAEGEDEAAGAPPADQPDADQQLSYADRLQQEASDPKAASTVFVSGLPYEWDVEKIQMLLKKQKCAGFGEIRAPTWHDTGRLRGYCHVEFASEEKAQKAISRLHHHTLKENGRYLTANLAKEAAGAASGNARNPNQAQKKLPEGCNTLFVKNLPYAATESEIADAFGGKEAVAAVRLGHEQGRSKGFCYLEFTTHAKASAVLKSQGKYALQGRILFLDADGGPGPKAGYHYRKEAWEDGWGAKVKHKNAPW